jgi:DNA polymerase-3 subunit chi
VTEIAFHFGVQDQLAYTCRLLRKATASGARLQVRSPTDTLVSLDAALWNVGPTDFISHCDVSAPDSVRSRSAVLLLDADMPVQPDFPILVNLAEDVPAGFEQFQRVIEIVSTDEHDRNLARLRWRHYTQRGYTINRHDVKSRGEG